ncbi:MAG: ubiquinone anaerobic biosynthesis accessory factor UbiT [Burkholderiales bacterium]
MISERSSAALPALLTCALGSLPTWPLQLALQRLANSIVTRHAGLLERLDADGARRFGIQPHDLGFAVVLEVRDGGVRLSVVPQLDHQRLDARITGNFLALLDLIDGRRDGDALFFSRELAIEGDIGAVLALRNAIDNAELDLLHEAAQLAQPWPGFAERMMRTTATALANMSAAFPGGLARRTR